MEEELGNWQHGFGLRRGSIHLKFTFKIALGKKSGLNKSSHIAIIYFPKAFDGINKAKLWVAIKDQCDNIKSLLMKY